MRAIRALQSDARRSRASAGGRRSAALGNAASWLAIIADLDAPTETEVEQAIDMERC
jgi:hypothetical protein